MGKKEEDSSMDQENNRMRDGQTNYIVSRRDFLYYKYVRTLISICSINAKSLIDVGSGGMDVISHCKHIPHKISLDLRNPVNGEGIEGIKKDFFTYKVKERFDIVCCFQVIEHIQEAEKFCQKLLELSNNILVCSVPYKWKKNEVPGHVQDPIDVDKLSGWFGFYPTFCNIVDKRLIAIFIKNREIREALEDSNGGHFPNLFAEYLMVSSSIKEQRPIPFKRMGTKKRIVLYGAGTLGKDYYKQLSERNYEILLWVDKNYKHYKEIGYSVSSIDAILSIDFDFVLIAIFKADIAYEVHKNLVKLGVREDKIIWQ